MPHDFQYKFTSRLKHFCWGFMTMQVKNILWISSLVSAVLLSTTPALAKEYYKWVDRNGSTHYTTTPPPNHAIKKGKIDTYGWHHNTTTSSTPTPAPNSTVENKTDTAATAPAATEKAAPGTKMTDTISQKVPAASAAKN